MSILKKIFCIKCKKELSLSSFYQKGKYCIKCYIHTLKGKTHPSYIDGRTFKIYYCIDCHKKINYYTWWYGKQRCRHCSKIGKRNNRYIHGEGNFPYSLNFTSKLKESIRKRDNYECQLCNLKEKNHIRGTTYINLIIHHIDYNKHNCMKDNLISLCHKCNTKVNANRDYWYAYFRYIMDNR